MRRNALINGLIFAVLFVAFLVVLLLADGYRQSGGAIVEESNLYLHNLLNMWWLAVILLLGVVAALYGIFRSAFDKKWRAGIWYAGFGVAGVVAVLFCIAGYAGTAYLPSTVDAASSLTIANSSSSEFTLKTMSWVSLSVPFVLAYIWYVWRKMNATPLTEKELSEESHQY